MSNENTGLFELISRIEAATTPSNELDVLIEVALFDPDVSIRPNSAGTKVIYTSRSGKEQTHRAWDHTLSAESRASCVEKLRKLQQEQAQ